MSLAITHTQNYCLQAENPCLSARCLFSRLGKEKGPSVHPSTGQGKGPLCVATCSRIVLRTLNNFSHTGQVNSFVVGEGLFRFYMSHQRLFCRVTFVAGLAIMLLIGLSATGHVKIEHGPG